MKGFYSPIDRLMEQSTRPRGTGAEYMAELSKKPGYKPQEAEDRNLQALMALPKMERAAFMEKLKANPAVMPKERVLSGENFPEGLSHAERRLWLREREAGPDEAYHEDYTLPGGTNYREILLQHPKGGFSGVEAHFGGAPNVLASIRAKDRVGPNGEKILHLEEIQSDWHQQGREKGYHPKGVDMDKTLAAAKNKHSTLQRQLQDAKANSKAVEQRKAAAANPEEQAMHDRMLQGYNRSIMDLMPQVMRADEELRKTQQLASKGVPDAPFKKDWHELALKKMIHHAAEKGYDQIAITPGVEQAKRYGLAKKLHSIEYSKGDDGRYHVIAIPHQGADLMGGRYELPEIEQYVGKDLTKQIAEDQGALNPHNDAYKVLSGQDLNIGGEGMKGFYDKMVPAFLNKFGKKHGVQVGTTSIGNSNPTDEDARIHHGIGILRWKIKTPEEKEQLRQQAVNAPVNLHTFNITPQMREDVLKNGIPLYAKGGSVEEDVPRETTKAYKMFRVDKKQPGKLFPLFVDADTPVEMNKWIAAKEGEKSTANTKKVKSKIGDLAYRPGWHAGDLPVATHIGEKDEEQKAETQRVRAMRDAHAATLGNTKAAKAIARKEHPYPSWVNAPRLRNPNHIWAEVEMPNDVDWQSEATKRGYNDQGKLIASQAHITDQLPKGGHYRYKTNSNMLGNWLIGGSMKVNRILHDKEVEAINKAAGAADLPRAKAMNQKAFGFAAGGTVGPEEFMAEEHVNYMADGGSAEYQGEHKPPSDSYGAPLHDLTQVYPEDIYSPKALQYYGMGHPNHKKMDMESLFKAQMYRDKPNASVSVFRAVPEHINEINPNDWVTLSPAYAKLHGESRLGGKYKTLKKMVKAKELWTAGDSIHEWGYHPEEKKAAGGAVKGKVTLSPNMDVMQYELLNKKAK